MMAARWQNQAPSPSKLGAQGQLLPPEQAAAAAQAAAQAAQQQEQAVPEGQAGAADEEYYSADEGPAGSQGMPAPARRSGRVAAAAAAAEAVPPAALALRTQPDDMQWTNANEEPAASLPATQARLGLSDGVA